MAAGPLRASGGESIGLFTSLPIQWREADSLRELLGNAQAQHWALPVLRAHGEVRPIDSFLPGSRNSPLKGLKLLVMAQPRALAPQENVALDSWVRRGGRLLLFADPMLTSDSRFSPGDPRRPQDVAMLSPILAHWGLLMHFDEEQALGEHRVALAGGEVPVNLPGRLALTRDARNCAILGEGIAAQCRIGRGRVLVVADAALLEEGGNDTSFRATALERLIALLGA